jgi:nucleoside-diphosphate-sugar epimerase
MVNGSGEQYRAFIHVDKLAHIIHNVLDRGITGIYNVVEHNLTIAYIVNEIKKLYPHLDVIHSNHNMPMHSIRAALPCKLESVFPFPKEQFEDELKHFKENFSF